MPATLFIDIKAKARKYIHRFNDIRLHGTLGSFSPAEFKKPYPLLDLSGSLLTIHWFLMRFPLRGLR
jgi:hypothetical protein